MKSCFVVLEPMNHMYKVIESAAARGCEIIAFHSSPLSAGGQYKKGLGAITEEHSVDIAAWKDVAKTVENILSALNGRRVAGTYAGVEIVLPVEAALRERVGLPTHGLEVMTNVLNKRWTRRRLREAGLSQLADLDPRRVLAEAHWPLGNRVAYLKPITGGGSIHVTKCGSVEDVRNGLQAWDEARLVYRPIMREHLMLGGGLFLEEGADGELMSLEGWMCAGKYHALGLTSRTVLLRDPAVEMGATFPYAHPLLPQIEAKIAAIHTALGLVHGATHTELIVGTDGSIELVELNVRFGGSDILLLMNLAFDGKVEDLLTDLACGVEPRDAERRTRGYACMQQLLAPSGTKQLDSVEVDLAQVVESRPLKELGSALASTDYQSDHIATYIVTSASYQETLDRALRVRSGAKVNGAVLGDDPNNVVCLR